MYLKNKPFISYQLGLAQLFAISVWLMISVIQWANNPKSNPGVWLPLIVRGTEAFSVFITSYFLLLVETFLFKKMKQLFAIVLLFPGIYLFSALSNIISLFIRNVLGYAPPKIDGYFYIQSLHFFIPLILVVVFVEIIRYRNAVQKETERKLEAEKLLHQSQWMMLRYQINPHFLFNALNSIRALVGVDDEKARKIVTEVSEYFRYSLSIKNEFTVSIGDELKAVLNFLEIQKIRFQNQIVVKTVIKEGVENYSLPVFALQTLVENAVKHGYKTSDKELKLFIEIGLENNNLLVSVKNSGRLLKEGNDETEGESTNTGLENLRNRLKYFDKGHDFKLYEEGTFVIAKLKVCAKLHVNESLENNHH